MAPVICEIVDPELTASPDITALSAPFLGFDQTNPHLELVDMKSGVITKTDKLPEYGLAYVTGLSHYQYGIKITGVKAVTGGVTELFYHVEDATFDLNPLSTVTLYNFEKL